MSVPFITVSPWLFIATAWGLVACRDDTPYDGAFDLPIAATVIPVVEGGLFDEPIGYVASGHTGQISILGLKQGRFLSDDPFVSFLRGAPLATGGARRLTSVAAYTPDLNSIAIFAGDVAFGQLVEVVHVSGRSLDPTAPQPIEPGVSFSVPVFEDLDNSGDNAVLDGFEVSPGYTTSEDWSLTYDGSSWVVMGSRSGRQEFPAKFDEAYVADLNRIAFTVTGAATAGDRFTVHTESGLREHDVGGAPLALAMLPGQKLMAMVIHDRATDTPVLRWFDPATRELTNGPALDASARPLRLAMAPDGTLLVADGAVVPTGDGANSGRIWELRDDQVLSHPIPAAAGDVALLIDKASGKRIAYASAAQGETLWRVDLDSSQIFDVNPWVSGTQSLQLGAPISGIEAIPVRHKLPQYDERGVQRWDRTIAVSLVSGKVVLVEESTGCLARTTGGPSTAAPGNGSSSRSDYLSNFETTHPSGPTLEASLFDSRHVQINPCGGIARAESWNVRFDQIRQGWVVEGTLSGLQQRYARENERYVTDNGEVSFLIRSGRDASGDGWAFSFQVNPGVVEANGDNNRDGTPEVRFDFPGDPVFFSYLSGPTDGAWDPVDELPFVLVPASSSDIVSRVEPSTGELEVNWR